MCCRLKLPVVLPHAEPAIMCKIAMFPFDNVTAEVSEEVRVMNIFGGIIRSSPLITWRGIYDILTFLVLVGAYKLWGKSRISKGIVLVTVIIALFVRVQCHKDLLQSPTWVGLYCIELLGPIIDTAVYLHRHRAGVCASDGIGVAQHEECSSMGPVALLQCKKVKRYSDLMQIGLLMVFAVLVIIAAMITIADIGHILIGCVTGR